MSPEEKEQIHDEKMAFARALLLGESSGKSKTPTRHIIGQRATRQKKNPWAGGFKSDALGVSPEQIPEAQAELAKHGVSCEFDPNTGQAIMESQEHYRKVCKATGMYTGRDGFHVPGAEGERIGTGRDNVEGRQRFRREVLGE